MQHSTALDGTWKPQGLHGYADILESDYFEMLPASSGSDASMMIEA